MSCRCQKNLHDDNKSLIFLPSAIRLRSILLLWFLLHLLSFRFRSRFSFTFLFPILLFFLFSLSTSTSSSSSSSSSVIFSFLYSFFLPTLHLVVPLLISFLVALFTTINDTIILLNCFITFKASSSERSITCRINAAMTLNP